MKYCESCGAQCEDQASFCPQCGLSFDLEKDTHSISTENEPAIQNTASDSREVGQQQTELSYFWYKLMYLLGCLALSGSILPWLTKAQTIVRLVWSLVSLIVFSGLSYLSVRHHDYLAGIPKDEDYHKLGAFYERTFGKKLKLIIAASIVTGVAVFLATLRNGDAWGALQIGGAFGLLSLPLLCIVWTFRMSGFVIIAALLVGMSGIVDTGGTPQKIDTTVNSSQFHYTDDIQASCAAILEANISEYAEKEVLVVTYEWTNDSQENLMPANAVTVTAFQSGIELDKAIFYSFGGNDLSFSEIRPGTTVELTEAFYLRTHDDVEVEITPAFDFTGGEIYASSVFQLES